MPKKNAKHAAAPTSGKKLTKAAFVRSLPDTMPAKDVVAQGVSAGLEYSEKYDYNTRSSARVKPAARAAAPRAAAVKAAPAAVSHAPAASGGSSEAAFRKLVLDLGIARAKSLLSEVESKLAALISGR